MACKGGTKDSHKSVLKHTDTVGALPSLETTPRVTAAKKLSHPGPGPVSTNPKINIESSPRRGFSTFIPCIDGGDGGGGFSRLKKKISKEAANKSYTYEEDARVTCAVTHSLESAVRKLSRTSPNRSDRPDLTGIRAGLAILARGYEQYRQGSYE